jgi:hypothetical protein
MGWEPRGPAGQETCGPAGKRPGMSVGWRHDGPTEHGLGGSVGQEPGWAAAWLALT